MKKVISILFLSLFMMSANNASPKNSELLKVDEACWEIAYGYGVSYYEEYGVYWHEVEDMIYEVYEQCLNWDEILQEP